MTVVRKISPFTTVVCKIDMVYWLISMSILGEIFEGKNVDQNLSNH